MINAFSILADSIDRNDPERPALPEVPEPGICCMTGEESEATIPRKWAIKSSFTRLDLLRAPAEDRVSVDVFIALNYKWARMSSWLCDGKTFQRLDRVGVRTAVFHPAPCSPWIAYATTSYKKHGVLLAPVNDPDDLMRYWVFENEVMAFSEPMRDEYWAIMNKTLKAGFGRSVIESLECPEWLLRDKGARCWLEFERWARPRYRTAFYRFMCYLLPSQEEMKCENKFEAGLSFEKSCPEIP